ncbi:MAG TPA: EamA family transporter [Acetobacteraceae bacterium]|nr:EamA family transporter [Acetobacteraceae bacterium]
MTLSRPALQRVLFLLLCLIWGMTWLAMKAVIAVVPPALFSGLRWTIAGALLLLWQALRHEPIRLRPHLLGRLTLVALLMITLNAVIMLYGLRHVGTGLASVISAALTPISLLGFAVALKQEQASPRQIGAIALGIIGILVLFGPSAAAGQLDTLELLGAVGIILSCTFWAAGSVLVRPLMRTMSTVEVAATTNLIGGLVLLALALPFEPGALAALSFRWGQAAWLGFCFLLFVGSLGATMIYFRLVRDWGASRTGTYAFVSPVVAVVLGVAVYGERLQLEDAIGMALMLGAAGLALRRGPAAKTADPDPAAAPAARIRTGPA